MSDMSGAPRYRKELKYLCTSGMLDVLEHRLQSVMVLDAYSLNGSYLVSSLYFDDYRDSCCFDNEMGISERYKFRIRLYNDDASYIRLEKKSKCNSLCHKKSSRLDHNSYSSLYTGDVSDFIHSTAQPLQREFAVQIRTRKYMPKIIVRYERKAFVYPQGNVRVTMDRNISASPQTEDFLNPPSALQTFSALDSGLHLLEVKYTDVLPYYIYQAVQMNILQQTTFSKYYIGRKAVRQYGGGIV